MKGNSRSSKEAMADKVEESSDNKVLASTVKKRENPSSGDGEKSKRRGGKGKTEEKAEEKEEEARERRNKSKQEGHRRGRRELLLAVYAMFRCKQCGHKWGSVRGSRVPGTPISRSIQACKVCQEKRGLTIFTGPYQTECYRCQALQWCDCLCYREDFYASDGDDEDYVYDYDDDEEDSSEEDADLDKKHLSNLCERCVKGLPCGGVMGRRSKRPRRSRRSRRPRRR